MIKYFIFLLQRPRICAIIEILERMMHMTKMTIDRVKRSLQPFVGCEIELDVNIGRNRVVNHRGELEATYRNVFVVKADDESERRLSFNYVDLVTGNVVVALHKNGHIYRLANRTES